MSRQEQHHIRDLRFSRWIRRECPDSSTGFTVFDIDFVLRNYKTKRLALLEVKCRRANMSWAQQQALRHMHDLITYGAHEAFRDWSYQGLWLVQFEIEVPGDGGRIWIDGIEVTEDELRHAMSAIEHPGCPSQK